jgi:replicative DNA helicase
MSATIASNRPGTEELSDPAAERGVLSSVFARGGDAWLDVSDILNVGSFTIDSNQAIWNVLAHVCHNQHPQGIDYPTFLSAAQSVGLAPLFEKEEERAHLRAVMNFPVRPESARPLAAKVRKLAIARGLVAQHDMARDDLCGLTGDEPLEHILATAEGPIFDYVADLAGNDVRATKLMGDGAVAHLRHLMDNPRASIGIPTGLRGYDRAIGGGLRGGSVDVILARPKTGKTQLADNIALNIVQGPAVPVLNLDTEMSWEEHLLRVAANLAGVPVNDIERGTCGSNPSHRGRIEEAAAKLERLPYYYRCILGEPFEETMSHMRRWVLKTVGLDENGAAKPCAIIFDYLKLMSSEAMTKSAISEWQLLGFMATALKNFAGRYKVPILAFGQLNREGDIAASDRIKWFSTSCSTYRWLANDEVAAIAGARVRYTHILNNELARHGPGMDDGDGVYIRARYDIARVEEGPLASELARQGESRQQGEGGFEPDASEQPEQVSLGKD